MLAVKVEEAEGKVLLRMITKLYINLRGFSFQVTYGNVQAGDQKMHTKGRITSSEAANWRRFLTQINGDSNYYGISVCFSG